MGGFVYVGGDACILYTSEILALVIVKFLCM